MGKMRVEKVQEAIRQEVSKMLLFDVKNPKIHDVSVTGVEVSKDLSYAKIFVSLYGAKEGREETWDALNKSVGFFRSEIAERVRLRYTPELHFVEDTSAAYAAHIEELLAKIKKEEK